MSFRKLLSGAAALALASIGVLATTTTAQAVEIDDTSRVEGPMLVTWYSVPTASNATWLFNYYQNGSWVRDDSSAMSTKSPPWLTDMDHASWKTAAAKADRASFPALGAEAGKIRFESGPLENKCLGLSASNKATPMDCASAVNFTALEKGAGIIFRSATGYYLQIDSFNTLKTNDVVDTDLFNGRLMTPVKRTVADVTATVDRVDGDTGFISGTGEPGATITITGPNDTPYTVTVKGDGTWGPVEVSNLPEGDTVLPVKQTIDGQAAGETSVTVNVPAAGEPLVANDDVAKVVQGKPTAIDVLANDTGKGPLELVGVTEPEHGTVSIVDGKLVYTADKDHQGADSFTYTVKDADGKTAQATVSVAVAAEAEVPLMAPAFALGSLVLAGAGAGLKLRRRVTHA